MQKKTQKRANEYLVRNRWHHIWKRSVSALACVVVFCTTYALILPGITLETKTHCGKKEHIHTEACYSQVKTEQKRVLWCNGDTLGVHVHTDSCYGADGQLACGYADFVIHEHDALCYDAQGALVCELPEIVKHVHSDACYELVMNGGSGAELPVPAAGGDTAPGTSGIDVGVVEEQETEQEELIVEGEDSQAAALPVSAGGSQARPQGITVDSIVVEETGAPRLSCTQTEIIPHEHQAECWDESGRLVCGMTEVRVHQHTSACYGTVEVPADTETLTCGQEESADHKHSARCYGTWELTCMQEEHVHVEECMNAPETEQITEAVTETELEIETEQATEAIAETETETEKNTEALLETETETETEKNTEALLETETESETEKTTEALIETETETETETEQITEAVSEAETETEQETEAITETEQITEAVSEAETETEQETEAIAETETEQTTEADLESEIETETETEQTSEVESETETEQAADATIETETEIGTEPTTEATTETEVSTEEETETELSEETVADNSTLTDESAELNEEDLSSLYLCGLEEHTHTEACWGEALELICGLEEHVHTEGCLDMDDNDAYMLSNLLSMEDEFAGWGYLADLPMMAAEGLSNGNDQTLPVTSISGSGTTYDPAKKQYKSNLTIDYKVAKASVQVGSDYVFTYPKGIVVPEGLINEGPKNLYDDVNTYAGTYRFEKNDDGTYSVRVHFDDTYVSNAGDTLTGKVTFEGILDVATNENGGFTFNSGSLELDIPAKDITYPGGESESTNYDISVVKDGTYDKQGDKLVYTVYVRSLKGTPDPIKFEDIIDTKGLTLGEPDIKVQRGQFEHYSQWEQYGSTWSDVSIGHQYDGNGKINIDLPGLNKGTEFDNYVLGNCYKITYTYDLLPGQTVDQAKPKNKVTVESQDTEKGQIVKDDGEKEVPVDKRLTINKDGSYSSDKINWTITINANNVNIAGAELTDGMFAQAGKSIVVNPTEGYEWIKEGETITGIRFVGGNETGINTNQYTITYSTATKGEWENKTVENTAVLDPTPGTEGGEIEGDKTVTVGEGSVKKDYNGVQVLDDGNTAEVTWTVTINVPKHGIPKGTIIEDRVNTGNDGSSKDQWMTRDQICAWGMKANWSTGQEEDLSKNDIKFIGSDGKEYSYQTIESWPESGKYTAFKIVLQENLMPPSDGAAGQLVFTYKTTVDLTTASIGATKYRNDIDVGGKKAHADYTYHKGGVVKTDGSDKTDTTQVSNEGSLTWKVKVTTDDKARKQIDLTDTLPQGVVLDKISLSNATEMELTIVDGIISGTNDNHQVNGTYNCDTGEIKLTLKRISETDSLSVNAEYIFTFDCHADTQILDTDKKHALTNTVSVKADEADFGSAEQTQEWTYNKVVEEEKKISKAASWENDSRRLKYSVLINPQGEDIVENAEVLTLIDELNYWHLADIEILGKSVNIKATLVPSSVKLYKAIATDDGNFIEGEEVKNWSWKYAEKVDGNHYCTITATGVPDSTPLFFKYDYIVESEAKKGEVFSLKINNTAKLEGTNYSDTHNTSENKWRDQSSSATITTDKSYVFYKVEKDNFGKVLPEAMFSLYKYNPTSESSYEKMDKIYTTNEKGMFTIQWKDGCYEYNTLYKVKETTPPEGYEIPADAPEYYFYFSNDENENNLPENLPATAVDLSKNGTQVFVENIKNTTSIEVNKEWFDSTGGSISNKSGSIEFNLYQIASETSPGGTGGSGSASGGEITYDIRDGNNVDWGPKLTGTIANAVVGSTVKFTVKVSRSEVNEYSTPNIYCPNANDGLKITNKEWNYDEKSCAVYATIMKKDVVLYVDEWDSKAGVVVECMDSPSPQPDMPDSSMEKGTPYGNNPYTISSEKGWSRVISELPKTGTANGKKVYYTYYVKEIGTAAANCTVKYVNNDTSSGIVSGTITIQNTEKDTPAHELPATGGPGTLPYRAAGLLLMAAAGILLMYREGRRRKDEASS